MFLPNTVQNGIDLLSNASVRTTGNYTGRGLQLFIL